MGARFNRKPTTIGLYYTQRQIDILNECIPLEEIRINELSSIMKKAREREDEMSYCIAEELRTLKTHPPDEVPEYTMDECKAILQSLTPWEINWD